MRAPTHMRMSGTDGLNRYYFIFKTSLYKLGWYFAWYRRRAKTSTFIRADFERKNRAALPSLRWRHASIQLHIWLQHCRVGRTSNQKIKLIIVLYRSWAILTWLFNSKDIYALHVIFCCLIFNTCVAIVGRSGFACQKFIYPYDLQSVSQNEIQFSTDIYSHLLYILNNITNMPWWILLEYIYFHRYSEKREEEN